MKELTITATKLLTAALLFASGCFWAQAPAGPAGEQQVRAAMAMQEQQWNAGNIPGFMAYYWRSDSLQFIGSRGITYGWDHTLANYQKAYPDQSAMGILKFDIISCTQLSPTSLYVIGRWELKKDKPAGGYYTLLWRKIKGQWLIVADHTS